MPRKKEDILADGFNTRYKAIGMEDVKMGKKVFGLVFPQKYQDILEKMDRNQRIPFMREAIIKAIDNLDS
ncbi:hypothetical protein IQ215_05060 [Cyanobacterium stanieri LEGE 03274]|uniref:CopG family transcriptional regulator n=1 Tax=Cyanobacterium stanieri LEGE 03274 TaxID=1828756 RepID=A0ABR9V2F3_9CHRO|nr:hypothetical protein [Cyanobacterium stanieri]MBE9222062.1 hypothetical protein [Cyanobacterium stanieri LEGE 03274]